jgi:DNA-binding NarL/FixJ family response regulator
MSDGNRIVMLGEYTVPQPQQRGLIVKSHGLLLIDSNPLRRAGIANLLSDWTVSRGISIKETASHNVLDDFGDGMSWQLLLFSLGDGSVAAGENATLMRALAALLGQTPLVLISDREEPEEILAACRGGCRGYLPTSMEPRLAVQALGFVLDGGTYFPPSALLSGAGGGGARNVLNNGRVHIKRTVTLKLRSGLSELPGDGDLKPGDTPKEHPAKPGEPDIEPSHVLTSRQQEVLDRLREGMPNKLIARTLGLTEGTVKVHVRQIMRKLQAKNRTEAAILGTRVDPDPSPIPARGEFRVINGANGVPRASAR